MDDVHTVVNIEKARAEGAEDEIRGAAAEVTQEAERAIKAEDLLRDDLGAAATDLAGVHAVALTGAALTRVIGGVTNVSQELFEPEMPWTAGKTLVYDSNGTVGVIAGADDGDFEIETASISPLGADEPTLLGNVAAYADLPATVTDAEALFGRTPHADDYARVIADETTNGHTVEYYITSVTDGNIAWGNPVVINTSDYQEQSDAGMAGKLLTGGVVAGTYGEAVDPSTFATAEDAANAEDLFSLKQSFDDFTPGRLKMLRSELPYSNSTPVGFNGYAATPSGKILRNDGGLNIESTKMRLLDLLDGQQRTSFPLRLITGYWYGHRPSANPQINPLEDRVKILDVYPQLADKISVDPGADWFNRDPFVFYTDTSVGKPVICLIRVIPEIQADVGQTLATLEASTTVGYYLFDTTWADYDGNIFHLQRKIEYVGNGFVPWGMTDTKLRLVQAPPSDGGEYALTGNGGEMGWEGKESFAN
ncbi:MAG: hypothetical protein LBK41_06535, partial [Clostridiales bacterium]|nr:hypothetical protein [Clostridiales bacterium]